METSFGSLFSTVVLETISFEPDVSSMRSNVAIVKNELLLDSTDVHHVCYNTINHIRWILLSSYSFSSMREAMPSHKLFTPSTTSSKRIFDGRIVFFSLKMLLAFHIIMFLLTWSILLRFL